MHNARVQLFYPAGRPQPTPSCRNFALTLLPCCCCCHPTISHFLLQAQPITVDVNAAVKAVQEQKAAVQAAVSQAVSVKVDAVNGAAAAVTKAVNDKVAAVSAAGAGPSISISAGKGGRKMLL